MFRSLFAILLAGSLMSVAACSSTSQADADDDGAQQDGGVAPQDAQAEDQAAPESSVPDVGVEASAPLCDPGSWGNVPATECDPIAQDCEDRRQTCKVVVVGGEGKTQCEKLGYTALRPGHPCDKDLDCAAGSVCMFGYCTRYCCPQASKQLCGREDACNLSVRVGGGAEVMVCGFGKPCTLWNNTCKYGTTCVAKVGFSEGLCLPLSEKTRGHYEGASCSEINDCNNGMGCLTRDGKVYECRYYCSLGGSPPWDAGATGSAPGHGGCPRGRTCQPFPGAPDWLGGCFPP